MNSHARAIISRQIKATGASLPAGLAAIAAFALYAITLGGSYVYDDTILHEDPRFTHVHQWSGFWTQAYMPGAVDRLYRPLTCMTFAVEFSLHGDRPWIYHLVNLLLHAGVAAAVAELARRLMGFRTACVAGLLFAVHPIHVEAVAGLVGRAELLCALATLGALILFLRPMRGRRVIAIAACFIVALLSKEQGILLPAFLLALVPFRKMLLTSNATSSQSPFSSSGDAGPPSQLSNTHPTSDNANPERGAMSGLTALLCLLAAAYIIFREQLLGFTWDRDALDWTANPLIRSTGADRLFMPLVLLGRYLCLLVAPVKLSLDYGTHVIGWTVDWRQPWVYLGAVTFAGSVIAFICMLRRISAKGTEPSGSAAGRFGDTTHSKMQTHAAIFCLIALGLSYGMVSNSVILIGTIFGERLMYLPSAFFLMLVSTLLVRLLTRSSSVPHIGSAPLRHILPRSTGLAASAVAFPRRLLVVVIILTALASIRTFTYARLWNEPLKLYLADLRDHPQSMHLHGLAVDWYIAHGDYHAARAIAEDSLRVLPDCVESYRMAVAADVKLNDFKDADSVLERPDRRVLGTKLMELRRELRRTEGKP